MQKILITTSLILPLLGACASHHQGPDHNTPNSKISKSHTALIPIAIGCAGLAIAFVAGSAGYSHDEPTGSIAVQ